MQKPKRVILLEDVQKILLDRAITHGESSVQLELLNKLKALVRNSNEWDALTPVEQEAIDNILLKISRMCTGIPIMDHWLDIIGYAAIGGEARDKADGNISHTGGIGTFERK